jgi:2-keto-4-pentenoate hydratase
MINREPYLRQGLSPPLETFDLEPDRCFRSLEAAYGAVSAMARAEPHRWAAWKLGGTNHTSRAAFGVSRCYFGPIYSQELRFVAPGRTFTTPAHPLAELKGEVELALRLGPDGRTPDAWAVALEMPASPILNLLQAGVAALVADRCAAGALLVGTVRPIATGSPLPDFRTIRFTQECDGTEVAAGTVADDLVATPTELLAEFLELAHLHNMPVAAGQWVATGGITPCIPYAAGQRVKVLFDGAVELDLRIGVAHDDIP